MVQNKDRGYFKRMCSEIQLKDVEIIGPPGPKQVMEASAKQVCPCCCHRHSYLSVRGFIPCWCGDAAFPYIGHRRSAMLQQAWA